jgi:hypothetical protein
MPINFDPNSLNSVFDKNFGAGAFNAGLSNAQKAAQLKTQASFAKTNYLKRLSDYQAKLKKDQTYMDKYGMSYADYQAQQEQKKANGTFDSALNYWSDKKSQLQKDGAYKTANNLVNDPKTIEDLQNQGYSISKLVDAAYNVASDGKFSSKKAYDQFANKLASDTKSERKANLDNFDYQVQQAEKKSNQQKQATAKASQMSLYDKLNAGGQRIGDQFLRTVFGNKFADWNNQQDQKLANYELSKNPNNTHAIKALIRDNAAYSPASTTGQKLLNYTGGTAGNILPFLVGDGLLGAAGKGISAVSKGTAAEKALAKLATNKITGNAIAKTALSGGASGIVGGGLQMGAHNVMSGEQYTPEQIRNQLLLTGGAGAVIPPALIGLNKGLNAGAEAFADKTMSKLLPKTQEDIQKVLSDYGKSVKGDNALPVKNTDINPVMYKDMIDNSTKLDPLQRLKINSSNNTKPIIPNFETTFKNAPQEDNILTRAEFLQGKQRTLPDFSNSKSVIEPADNSNVNVYGVDVPKDLVKDAPPEYWQKRYEDFTKYVKDQGYNANNLSPEAINELWTHFAKPTEPSLNAVVDLAYKGYKAPLNTADAWSKMGNRPPVSKSAKDILGLPKIEQQISRSAPKDVSGSPLFLKASSLKSENVLKTVSTNKTLDVMSKDELKAVYKQLEDKKASLTMKKSSKKQLIKVEEDLKKVNDFLMKPDLQMFGNAAEKKSTVRPINQQVKTNPKQSIKQQKAIEIQRQKKLVEDYKNKKNDVKAGIADMLKNSDNWKDKGDFALGRETMKRNFEDVMGKDAEVFKEKFLNPISSDEAKRVRFLNTEREWAKSHEIKPKSLEDQLVQMYGEKKITLDELKQKTSKWEKIVQVADDYRKKYDELLTKVNKVLEDNGFPPIPKRADYFPHYEEIDGLMKKFGFDMNNNALPTDINGLTDNFKPNKQFFANALRRKGDETTFGAIQGFDRYLEGISNVIYHTKNIRQLRALNDVIRTKYQGQEHLSQFASKLTEYTNLLAGKKSRIDRSVEDAFGRKVYNVVDTIRRRTGANIVGANISSALTNFIPLTHSLATTNKQAFVKGMVDTLANIGKDDGFIQKSDFLTKRIGSDPLYRNLWDKTVDKSMWLMRTFDNFTSQVIVRGKYNELIAKGIPEEQAIKQADEWANKIIAGRGKGDMPTLFGSKTFGIVSQFQLEVNNQLSFLMKDLPRNSTSKAALASSVGQILLYSYMFNNLYEKAVGRRPAFDPVGIAFQAVKDYNNDNLTKGEATKNLGTNIANQLPFTSIFTGGRFPISSGMPDVGGIATGTANWKGEAVKPLLYLGLPTGGGQIKKAYEGLTSMNKNPLSPQGTTGVYQGDKLKFPVENNIPNNIRGTLFGKYSFPEAKDFYDNSRSALSAKQTQQVEMNPDFYQYILEQQRLKRLKKQMQGK